MQSALWSVVLIGLTVLFYQIGNIVQKIQSWDIVWDPPTVGQMLIAVSAALGAVGAALKIDVSSFLRRKPPE